MKNIHVHNNTYKIAIYINTFKIAIYKYNNHTYIYIPHIKTMYMISTYTVIIIYV